MEISKNKKSIYEISNSFRGSQKNASGRNAPGPSFYLLQREGSDQALCDVVGWELTG